MSKVMLVEDDNNLREIYGARLEAEGYDIVSAKDGEEALALAVQEKPDLIISDVMMPRISGFDMLDILRNAPETKETKVIMMTALSQAEDKARADKLGADRYLVKSQVTLEDVANVVREVLEGPGAAATASAAPTPAPAASSEPAAPAPQSVESIANPIVEVHDEPDPSQVQTPPADTPAEPVTTHQPFQFKPTEQTPPTPAPAAAAPQPQPQPQAVAQPALVQPVAATPAAPIPVAAPAPAVATPAPIASNDLPPIVQPANSAPIKVELPQAAAAAAAAAAAPAPAPTAVPDPTPLPLPATEPDTGAPAFVGPNLAQALASEEAEIVAEPPAPAPIPAPTPVTLPIPAAPVPTVPTVSNGTPSTTVIQPTQPAPIAPDPAPVADAAAATAAGMRVIQPINDPTAAPDLNKLVADEERKAAVANPTATTVITPETSSNDIPMQQQNLEVKQQPKNDVNNISL